jgi:hypothetical protein
MSKSMPGKRSPCPKKGYTEEAWENTMLESSLVDTVDTCSVEKSTIRMMELWSSHTNTTSNEESYFIRPKLSNRAEAKSPSKLLFAALPVT